MKIIIPIEFYRKGGVERVIVSLVSALEKYAEKIVILIYPGHLEYFQSLLPASEVIVYESFILNPKTIAAKKLSCVSKAIKIYNKLKFEKISKTLSSKLHKLSVQSRINQLVYEYQIDYCLYAIINKLEPPKISIPLTGIAYDLFWQFSPLTYSEIYKEKYNKPLKMWLDESQLIFTISEKTSSDILKLFSEKDYRKKIKAVPLAGSPISLNSNEILDQGGITFYFPSSFGIYKDHLTLLKAALSLAQKNLKFKLILTGKETDSLVNGNISLSQQSSTKEYKEYVMGCYDFCQDNKEFIQEYIKGCGYAEYKDVEYYYRTCSCVVMPSKYEGFGLAISEALLLGIPVIAADLEVYKEQVELYQSPDRVTFFPTGDVEALTTCLENFILNPRARLSPGEIAQSCRPWTWDDVAKGYIEALKSL